MVIPKKRRRFHFHFTPTDNHSTHKSAAVRESSVHLPATPSRQEFVKFLNQLEKKVPPEQEVHPIMGGIGPKSNLRVEGDLSS